MESWRKCFVEGILPAVNDRGLLALHRALAANDPALIQGQTTEPIPDRDTQDQPVTGACAVALCGWRGESLDTVAQVEDYFARIVVEADRRLGVPGCTRIFFHWHDGTRREAVRLGLLAEVEKALADRGLGHRTGGKEGAA